MTLPLDGIRVKNICGIYNINFKDKRRAARNDRKCSALVFKLSGKTEYICGDKRYICDCKHVLFVPKNIPYVYNILDLGPCISIEFESETETDSFVSYKISDNTKIKSLFVNISQTWAAKGSGYMLAVFSMFYEILHTTFVLSNTDYTVQKKEKALLPAVSYIQEHYANSDLTNKKLACISGMSTVYFRKLFTKRFGVSPMKYLSNIKIDAAKNLLLSNNFSVSDVAEAVGFSSVYSFSRAFKKSTGLSPTEFLKENTSFSF